MRKYYLPTILFLLGLALMIPVSVLAVQDVVISSAIDVYLADPGATLTISPVTIDQIAVGTSTVTITMPAGGSNVTITSADRYKYTVTGITNPGTVCSEASSVITLYGQASQTAVTLDPAGTCPSGGGGGGGGAAASAAPAQPNTSTGQVTATASLGGRTSVVSAGITASALVSSGTFSADTVVSITPTATTASAVTTATSAVPSGKLVVGGQVYNYSATSGGATVSTFSKPVTVSISYTAAQIAGIDVTSLKVYYWDATASQWVALASTVNTTEKTVSANTTHFTYFAVMGTPGTTTALTLAELKAEIVRITALIAELQTQLLGMIGGVEGCTITSFDKNLQSAMTGDDVKCLQILLNSSADTQVASSGVGSPGSESSYFGALTKVAVIKFQNKYASEVLTPWGLTSGNGFVGSKTRAKLNEMLIK